MNSESHDENYANLALREMIGKNRSSLHLKEDKFSFYPIMIGPNMTLALIASNDGVMVHLNIGGGKNALLLTFLDFDANNTVDHINCSINNWVFDCFMDKTKARKNGAIVDQLIPTPDIESEKDTPKQREQLLSICNHAISLALDILGDVLANEIPDITLKDFGYVNFVKKNSRRADKERSTYEQKEKDN